MVKFLEPFSIATLELSKTSIPLHGSLRVIFQSLLKHLDNYIEKNNINIYYEIAQEMKDKLTSYWTYLSQSSTIPTLFDPSVKLETFNEEERQLAISLLKISYSIYHVNEKTPKAKHDSLKYF